MGWEFRDGTRERDRVCVRENKGLNETDAGGRRDELEAKNQAKKRNCEKVEKIGRERERTVTSIETYLLLPYSLRMEGGGKVGRGNLFEVVK